MINTISQSTFAIYVVHQIPAFYREMWNGIFNINSNVYKGNIIIYSVIVISIIFAAGVLIDNIRKFICSRFIYKTQMYKLICDKIEKYY